MHITAPDARELLLPVLACLPTAFLGPRPPAAFLPLLSPILRQRVHLFTSSSRNNEEHLPTSQRSEASNWLSLLTWSPERASRLIEIVGGLQLEPHPVSGELELFGNGDGDGKITYRRLDQETLQSRCDVTEHEITVIWVWCENDTGAVNLEEVANAESKSGWRVAEVRPVESGAEERWYESMTQAEDAELQISTVYSSEGGTSGTTGTSLENADDDDDDDYWASYDRTPATRTPAKRSPVPMSAYGSARPNGQRQPSSAEAEYFARYAEEVQPAMDAHDPDEALDAANIESSFSHHTQQTNSSEAVEQTRGPNHPTIDEPPITTAATHVRIHSPAPSRPSSAASNIEQLEASASSSSAAEMAVKQHVGYELKSLYRLAKATGIDREEFERIVKVELQTLAMMDMAD